MSKMTNRIVTIGSGLALLGLAVWYLQSADGSGAKTN